MDCAILPPEINSGRMYSGPGAGPILTAAAAWDVLAAELHSAAASYEFEIANLTAGPWLGPTSATMAAAAGVQVAWLSATAVRAEEAATQAKAAASAYGAAFAMTVPPPVIAANRALLLSLLATNILGQNAAAIAATEAQYSEMWAQDAAAMYGYASTSAAAATLTPFSPAPAGSNPGAVAHTALSQLTSAVPAALRGLASPLQSTSTATSSTSGLGAILQSVGLTSPISLLTPANTGLTTTGMSGSYAAWNSASHADAAILGTQDQISGTEDRIMNRFDRLGRPGAGAGSAVVSADVGRARLVGDLSVPRSWAAAAPAMRTAVAALPATSLSAAADGLAISPGSLFSEMALANGVMAGRAVGGSSGRRQQVRATVRAGVAAPHTLPSSPLTGVAADLWSLAECRDFGILTDDEFNRQKRRLLGE